MDSEAEILRHILIYDTGLNNRTCLPWNPSKMDRDSDKYDHNRCIRMKDLGKDAVAFVLKEESENACCTGYIAANVSKFIMTRTAKKRLRDAIPLKDLFHSITVLPRHNKK